MNPLNVIEKEKIRLTMASMPSSSSSTTNRKRSHLASSTSSTSMSLSSFSSNVTNNTVNITLLDFINSVTIIAVQFGKYILTASNHMETSSMLEEHMESCRNYFESYFETINTKIKLDSIMCVYSKLLKIKGGAAESFVNNDTSNDYNSLAYCGRQCDEIEEQHALPDDEKIPMYMLKSDKRAEYFYWIVVELLNELLSENENNINFPIEALKFFLAIHKCYLSTQDFITAPTSSGNSVSTAAKKIDRKSTKNTGVFTNGTILCELIKGFDTIGASMNRCDTDDHTALINILRNEIVLPIEMYEICSSSSDLMTLTSNEYVTDMELVRREDCYQFYVQSPFKHAIILITDKIVMLHDGHQFVMPSSIIDQVFRRKYLLNNKISSIISASSYLILDVMLNSTNDDVFVIDILKIGNSSDNLPTEYVQRLNMVSKMLPNTRNVLELFTSTNGVSSSGGGGNLKMQHCGDVLQKLKNGYGPAYIYYKLNLITAAVGLTNDKNVVLAFLDQKTTETEINSCDGEKSPLFENNNTDYKQQQQQDTAGSGQEVFQIKAKASIIGPAIYTLTTAPRTSVIGDDTPSILFNDKKYSIIGDVSNIELFNAAIPLEFKENNKIGNINYERRISYAFEYKQKQPTTVKESSTLALLRKQFDTHPSLMDAVIKMIIKKKPRLENDTKDMIRGIIDSNVQLDLGDFNIISNMVNK